MKKPSEWAQSALNVCKRGKRQVTGWAKSALNFSKRHKKIVIPTVIAGSYLVYAYGSSLLRKDTEIPPTALTYTQLKSEIDNDDISDINFNGEDVTGHLKDGTSITSSVPSTVTSHVLQGLEKRDVKVSFKKTEPISWSGLLFSAGYLLFTISLVFGTFLRPLLERLGFGRRYKVLKDVGTKFSDVAGIDEAKQDMVELVEFLKDPVKFNRLGGKIPKGTLLVGPPGGGKTLLARAVAGEAGVPFLSMSGSDFIELYVGVGPANVRGLFATAKRMAPCIIFIDEIDAVGSSRGDVGRNSEDNKTLNELLVQTDGIQGTEGIILIAATNTPDALDAALRRPGRFDRTVVVPYPDLSGREKILEIHVRDMRLAPNVKLLTLAQITPGFSPAQLKNMANEAAISASANGKEAVEHVDFEKARDREIMGKERKSLVISKEERAIVSYHETGHAIMGLYYEGCDPVNKVTNIPHGIGALGVTMIMPETDRYLFSVKRLKARIVGMMGGRAAEIVKFGEGDITSGASSDIEEATKLAHRMVVKFGMSKELGTVAYDLRDTSMSEKTAQLIDEEVKSIVGAALNSAIATIKDKNEQFENLAQAVMAFESLSGEDIRLAAEGKLPLPDIPAVLTPAPVAEPAPQPAA